MISKKQRYLYFLLANPLDSLVSQKLKKSQFFNFAHFSMISSKLFKSGKSDSKNLKKHPQHVIKIKIFNFYVQAIEDKDLQTDFEICARGIKNNEN